MSSALVIAMPGNERFASEIAAALGTETGQIETRHFPDGESYVRFRSDVRDRELVMVATLDRPDCKYLPLHFAAAAARELGASRVGLVAPYLAYMRQDRRFHEGEAVTSRTFARLLSSAFDWLVTVDPHLHRTGSLSEIYSIPAKAVHAAPLISDWIKANVVRPVIVGPDAESEQWVSNVAARTGAPYRVLSKERHGDRDVEISVPDLDDVRDRTPVLVDDIVSSGRTMIEAVRQLRARGLPAPVCVAVHALFADASYRALQDLGATVVSTDTVAHPSNTIESAGVVAECVKTLRPVPTRPEPERGTVPRPHR